MLRMFYQNSSGGFYDKNKTIKSDSKTITDVNSPKIIKEIESYLISGEFNLAIHLVKEKYKIDKSFDVELVKKLAIHYQCVEILDIIGLDKSLSPIEQFINSINTFNLSLTKAILNKYPTLALHYDLINDAVDIAATQFNNDLLDLLLQFEVVNYKKHITKQARRGNVKALNNLLFNHIFVEKLIKGKRGKNALPNDSYTRVDIVTNPCDKTQIKYFTLFHDLSKENSDYLNKTVSHLWTKGRFEHSKQSFPCWSKKY